VGVGSRGARALLPPHLGAPGSGVGVWGLGFKGLIQGFKVSGGSIPPRPGVPGLMGLGWGLGMWGLGLRVKEV